MLDNRYNILHIIYKSLVLAYRHYWIENVCKVSTGCQWACLRINDLNHKKSEITFKLLCMSHSIQVSLEDWFKYLVVSAMWLWYGTIIIYGRRKIFREICLFYRPPIRCPWVFFAPHQTHVISFPPPPHWTCQPPMLKCIHEPNLSTCICIIMIKLLSMWVENVSNIFVFMVGPTCIIPIFLHATILLQL